MNALQDLDEDVVITLVAKNPQAPKTKIRFDHTAGEFISIKVVESMIDHLEIESTCLHKDSDEAQKQMQIEDGIKEGFKAASQRIVKNAKKEKLVSLLVNEGNFIIRNI